MKLQILILKALDNLPMSDWPTSLIGWNSLIWSWLDHHWFHFMRPDSASKNCSLITVNPANLLGAEAQSKPIPLFLWSLVVCRSCRYLSHTLIIIFIFIHHHNSYSRSRTAWQNKITAKEVILFLFITSKFLISSWDLKGLASFSGTIGGRWVY